MASCIIINMMSGWSMTKHKTWLQMDRMLNITNAMSTWRRIKCKACLEMDRDNMSGNMVGLPVFERI